MKHIKTFRLFESAELSEDQIEFLNRFVKGTWKLNSSTGLVDVDGDVDCFDKKLKNFSGIKFGRVGGDFHCSINKLSSLNGAPEKVSGDFNCAANNLTSLEGAPKEVGGDFHCNNNVLTSLKGAPEKVGGDFICRNNKLSSLEGAPEEVGDIFDCSNNNLSSLEGAPKKVGGDFNCDFNKLSSLTGAPKKVSGNFICINNNLSSLEGGPENVSGNFGCINNNLSSLEGAPKKIGELFYCDEFELREGKWNLEGWLKVFLTGKQKAKDLVLTIIGPEELNREIQKDPEEMMMNLKGVWNSPDFAEIRKGIKIPSKYEKEMDTLADLTDLGF